MTHTAPTPSVEKSLGEIVEWQRQHERHDDERFLQMQAALGKVLTKEDLEEAVQKAMTNAVFRVGRSSKLAIITTATIIGSLVVIGGGVQWLLNILGFVRN